MTTLFELDQLTVRASVDSALLRTRSYTLLDANGVAVGDAVQGAVGIAETARRTFASSRATMSATFVVHDAAGGLVMTVAKRRSGVVSPKVTIEGALANGVVVAKATSIGRSAREYDVTDPQGNVVATLRRAPRVLFAVVDATGHSAGFVGLDANTLSARRAGNAHPHSYTLTFEPAAPTLLRIASIAVLLGVDSVRGV